MKMPNIAGLAGVGKAFVMANRPEILFGASIVSTVAAVVSAARGGYKSGQQVLEEEMKRVASPEAPFDTFHDYYQEFKANGLTMTTKEKAQLTWLNYLPSAGLTLGALGSTTGLHLVHVKEKKALAATALLAIEEIKKESEQYQTSLKKLGVALTDEPSALEAAADDSGVARFPNSDGEIEELYLVRDAKTGRDIWSNKAKIEGALLELNEQLAGEGDAELNYFYTYAGYNNIPEGSELGWNNGDRVKVSWKDTNRDDGRPVREFTFRPAPKATIAK